jgi:hypothetical protein
MVPALGRSPERLKQVLHQELKRFDARIGFRKAKSMCRSVPRYKGALGTQAEADVAQPLRARAFAGFARPARS